MAIEENNNNNNGDTKTSNNNNNNNNTIIINNDDAEIEKKSPLKYDFESLIASTGDEPPGKVVIVPSTTVDGADKRHRKKSTDKSSASSNSGAYNLGLMSETDIIASIERSNRLIKGGKLPDKGAKMKNYVHCLEEELEHRKFRRSQQEASGCKKPAHSASASSNGALKEPKGSVPSSQPSQSQFTTILRKKMGEIGEPKSEQNTGDQASNAFGHELSYWSHGGKWKDNGRASNVSDQEGLCLSRCDKSKRKVVGQSPQSKRTKPALSSKGFSAWNPPQKYKSLNGYLCGKSSIGSIPISNESRAGSFTDKEDAPALNSDCVKNEKTVVLVDEEEPALVERGQDAEQIPSSTNEGKIYYPNREDPESLEIFRSELKCLEPGECLTSTIMNFYVRYLQVSPGECTQRNFYFFNTYFYSKLQKAIAHKKSDKEAFFIKFRRWWKGANLFQKAYILLPINEDNHWSLVIICIPDKEDDSGIFILHLDSLGLHSSSSIFHNIKSLLINEWKLVDSDDTFEVPTSERLWKNLPRRIEEKIITVPRQTNDYDCGLFVLYYMECFIQQAPNRLKRQHLNMFGKNWFKPQEASGLRGKIKKILEEEFRKALAEDNTVWQPVSLSANAETAKAIDHDSCGTVTLFGID